MAKLPLKIELQKLSTIIKGWLKEHPWLALLTVILLLIGIVGVIFYRSSGVKQSLYQPYFTTRPEEIEISGEISRPPVTAGVEAMPNLQAAQAILSHLTATTDIRGFYGSMAVCPKVTEAEELRCWPFGYDYLDLGASFTEHRTASAVIWARYQYFLKTGAEEQLKQLLLDLENLIANVLDSPVHVLQTDGLNCFLLQELYASPYLDEQTKTNVERVCFEADPEVHPESAWEYDQHQHVLYNIAPSSDVAYTDPERVIADSLRHTFSVEELQTLINTNLTLLANGVATTQSEYSLNVSPDDKVSFFEREISAALNYLGAYQISSVAYPETAEPDLIDYLIFTNETLEWLGSGASIYGSGTCLAGANVKYYLQHFAPALLTSQQQRVLAARFTPYTGSEDLTCLIAADYLFPEEHQVIAAEVQTLLDPERVLESVVAKKPPGDFFYSVSDGINDAYMYSVNQHIFAAGAYSRYF